MKDPLNRLASARAAVELCQRHVQRLADEAQAELDAGKPDREREVFAFCLTHLADALHAAPVDTEISYYLNSAERRRMASGRAA